MTDILAVIPALGGGGGGSTDHARNKAHENLVPKITNFVSLDHAPVHVFSDSLILVNLLTAKWCPKTPFIERLVVKLGDLADKL